MTAPEPGDQAVRVTTQVNGKTVERVIDPASSLLDFIRDLGLTGTHSGCEHGVCGACTVLIDGEPARACIVLAAQMRAETTVETVESIGGPEHPCPLQVEFSQCSGLQCGFCTPGFLMLATSLLRRQPRPTQDEIRETVSSNICRCTGYSTIVEAISKASER